MNLREMKYALAIFILQSLSFIAANTTFSPASTFPIINISNTIKYSTVLPFDPEYSTVRHEETKQTTTKKIELYLGGFFSIGGNVWDGSGLLPAVEMALEHVNERSDILIDYELKMVWNDSKCEAGLGTRFLFKQLFHKPQKLVLIGPACSTDTQAVAQTSYYWNLLTVSYSASSSALSNRKEYPFFFRTYVADAMYNPVRISILKKFNWTRVATIHQTHELFSLANDNLRTLLKENNITLVTSESFGKSPTNHMQNIKDKDATIIIGNMYETDARKVFCEAFHLGLYGERYVWLLLGWYSKNWWLVDDDTSMKDISCTADQLAIAVESSLYISTEVEGISTSEEPTVAGYTAREIRELYQERMKLPQYADYKATGLDFFGYDALWAIALMLNTSAAILQTRGLPDGPEQRLEDFNYDNKEMAQLFFNVTQNTSFIGATGPVTFSNADRNGITKVEQLQGSCVEGWLLHGRYCYNFIFDEEMSWTDAMTSCQVNNTNGNSGGNSDSMLSSDTLDSLDKWYKKNDTLKQFPVWHIGLREHSAQGEDVSDTAPRWLPSGDPLFRYPDDTKCFAIDFEDNGNLVHVSCGNDAKPFICRSKAEFTEKYITSVINTDTTINLDELQWPGGVVPLDHTPIIIKTLVEIENGIYLPIFIVMCTLSIIGILMAVFFLIFNIYFANQRFVKLSSPKLNNLIIIGCILMYVSICMAFFHLPNKTHQYPALCTIRTWMVSIGFVTSFGAMFSKTWRVHRIATFKTPKRRIITDRHLFGIVAFLLITDVVILTCWHIWDPQKPTTAQLQREEYPHQIVHYFVRYCTSDKSYIWFGVLCGYKGLLLLFGTFLAWETRKVTIPALNDSKLIGISVYNVIILCVIGVGVSFVLQNDPSSLFLFISSIMLFCTSVTLIIIFVPKIISVYKDPSGMKPITKRPSIASASELSAVTLKSITDENKTLREKIMTLQELSSSSLAASGSSEPTPSNKEEELDSNESKRRNKTCGIWLGRVSCRCRLCFDHESDDSVCEVKTDSMVEKSRVL